jgi:CBS domain-containing protein
MNGGISEGGSYVTPRLEHARVADAMRHGVLSCPVDASLRDAARTMSRHHVHMIVATDPTDDSPVGTLSDSALLSALLDAGGEDPPLEGLVDRSFQTISSDEHLAVAARLMRDDGTAHLLVRDAHNGKPIGMVSTLDVAGILAWGEA